MLRIGHGYDAHRFCEGRRLIIGGVDIPYEIGLSGHSDADVLLHAISDSLLGAAALGDIGKLFPDTDARFKNISSLILLKETSETLSKNGYRIINIDATIVVQNPKMSPYIEEMRQNIARTLSCDIGSISIKATTEEGMGFTGRREGICAHSFCLIEKQ
ncbi:MAG: 2-C-methyl-D-erythritol 2,4-cyclodiphosphate synthase [Firmicutes bacterium ADurb.Bin300]|jgi:2-C-methyl-D-erythritol 2,4-cyclodiphosphate synthase|nr:MAG: 2-C-methyl-D-erythritol 2,4-cyclodiphosphate synthase [Firmicutes bacterium ADurb.Bin300]